MAHLVKLGTLTDDLIAALTPFTTENNPTKISRCRDSALRALKSQNHTRTNQFDVQTELEGLEEKFRVLNKDALGDALHERLDELETERSDKWTPEILSLLLLLSDQPVKKSNLEDLDFLRPPEIYVEPLLKWKDLVREDPELREKSIWKNIDYAAESSEDEYSDNVIDEPENIITAAESTVDDEEHPRLDNFCVKPDTRGLQGVKEAQFWVEKAEVTAVNTFEIFPQRNLPITESQAIREVLFMLAGLPTSLFTHSESIIRVNEDFRLSTTSPQIFQHLLKRFAQSGNRLMVIRQWTSSTQSIMLLQNFQEQISRRLGEFDATLSRIQGKYVPLAADKIVSLSELELEIEDAMRVMDRLAGMVLDLKHVSKSQPFRCLDLLYDATCTSQMAGEDDIYEFTGNLFFDTLDTYLRPVRTWMEEGELRKDDRTFFVAGQDVEVDLSSIWQDRFQIRRTTDGVIHCPKFMIDVAHKIFNTGKSIVVMKELGQYRADNSRIVEESLPGVSRQRNSQSGDQEPPLRFQTVCSSHLAFAPFSELFNTALCEWVQSKRYSISSTLRECLFEQCGLAISLDALQCIYFLSDGFTSSLFSDPIFSKLAASKASWSDRFTLTELAQSTFGTLSCLSPEHIKASFITTSRYSTVIKARRSVKSLSMLSLQYRLPWPVQIIISRESMATYQAILTFLLQIRRSQYTLNLRLLHDPLNMTDSADERALLYSLRARLLWFTATLYTYLTNIVLQSNTTAMSQELKEADDVDDMIRVHQDYIKRIRDQALLGSRLDPIRKTILSILDLALRLDDARARNSLTQSRFATSTSSQFRHSTFTRMSSPRKKQAGQGLAGDDGNSSDEEDDLEEPSMLDDGDDDKDTELEYVDRLKSLRSTFDHLLKFLREGLRGVARADGSRKDTRLTPGNNADGIRSKARNTVAVGPSASWEVLAAMLDA